MIKTATVHFTEAAAALLAAGPPRNRGAADRVLTARDLVEFGRCPARWVRSADAEDLLADHGPTLTEWLAFEPKLVERYFVRRPNTYEAACLRCPKCNSAGPAKSCTKCGLRRRNVIEPRAWSSAARHCAAWNAKHETAGVRIVSGAEWDRAKLGAMNLLTDRAILDLALESDRLVMLTGTWHDEATGLDIPVRARATLLPRERTSLDHTVVSFADVRNADPRVWEAQLHGHGAGVRGALLLHLAEASGAACRTNLLWIVAEKDAPRLIARRRAAPEVVADGRETLALLMRCYAQCLALGQWPAFEAAGESGLMAWTESRVQPWMTAGQGADGGYFAPGVVLWANQETMPNVSAN